MTKNLFSILIYSFLLFILSQNIHAQTEHEHEHDHDHDHEHHDHDNGHHHKNEIGIANSLVYIPSEKEFAYGLHLHYLYEIGQSRFGLGLAYERVFDEHGHHTIGIATSYRPLDHFHILLSPGITFEEFDHIDFSAHVEVAYEFLFNGIHIGPLLEFAYDKHEYHISLGLHVGIGF